MASGAESSQLQGPAATCKQRRVHVLQRLHSWACSGAVLHRLRSGPTSVRLCKSTAPQSRHGSKSSGSSYWRCRAHCRLTISSMQKCQKCMWKQVNTEPGESSAPTKASLGLVEYSDSEDSSDSNPYEEVCFRLCLQRVVIAHRCSG